MTRKVRTTIQPHKEIEVGDAEYTDLERGGLLYEPPVEEPAPRASKSTEKRGQGAADKKG